MHEILTFAIPVLKDLHKHGSCSRNDALGRFSDIVLVVLVLLGKSLLDVDLGKSGRDIRPRTPFVAGVDARDFAAVLLKCDEKKVKRKREAGTTIVPPEPTASASDPGSRQMLCAACPEHG